VGRIDIPPTVVELAGLPVPPSFEGVSLSALIRGAPSAPGPERVFTEGGYDQTATQLTVRERRWKLIHVRSLRERSVMTGAEYELYDLEVDRGESRNLVADHPEVVARLRARLEAWYGGATRRAELGDEIDLEALDDRSRDMLRALGYLQDGN
jgi:arylsulfatase